MGGALGNKKKFWIDVVLKILFLLISFLLLFTYPAALSASIMFLADSPSPDPSFRESISRVWNYLVIAYPLVWLCAALATLATTVLRYRLESYIFSVVPIVYVFGLYLFYFVVV